MRLYFDARYIRVDYHDGISRYSTELAAEFVKIADVVFLINDERQRAFLPEGAAVHMFHSPTSALEPFSSLILNRISPDVVFSPMQTIGSAGRKFPLILTLHDTIYYRHRTPPPALPWPVRIGWRIFHLSYVPQRITLNAADLVVTVSETSKRIFEKVRLTKRPVIVAAGAPRDLTAFAPAATGSGAPRNLLYMGSFMTYKNVETLIRGMGFLPGRTLHLLSRISPARQAEYEAIVPAGASVLFHNGVTDTEYATLLADDAALVTASLDEGYGLPVAEALAFGAPAVISELEIFHEVAGDGALYFDPADPRAFADRVAELDDDAFRARVIAAGTARMREFSWAKSARILVDAAESLVRKG